MYYPLYCEGWTNIYSGNNEAWLLHKAGKLVGKLQIFLWNGNLTLK